MASGVSSQTEFNIGVTELMHSAAVSRRVCRGRRRACAAGYEAADVVSVGALLHVPDHRLADRIAGIVDDRLRRNPSPFSLDRYPIAVRPHVVIGAMTVGDIAAGNAVRAADAFEPGPYIIGNIFVLTIIESRCRLRQARQGSNQ